MDVWYIDLRESNPVVEKYEERYLNEDLRDNEVSDPMELSDYDWVTFKTEREAKAFLFRFRITRELLHRLCTGKGLKVAHMLYKRRYLVQTLMGLKSQTVRDYDKGLKRGDLLNLHDQTHFLTVEITSVEKTGPSEWTYRFKLAKP